MSQLFCFGLGYSAATLAQRLAPEGWTISGTSTTAEGVAGLAREGWQGLVFDGNAPSMPVRRALASATHVLISAPPGLDGDSALKWHARDFESASLLSWIGYLSTIGVYGDRQGGWVDETSPALSTNERSKRRIAAENSWLEFGKRAGKRVQVFRLAGIYGPGRSAIDNLRDGSARRIVKPGQVFNRIHVDDIASALTAAMSGRGQHTIYNVTDDEPAPPQDVVGFAAALLGIPSPPEVPFTRAGLSSMASSFYSENKRVRNERLKADLGVALAYPTYREGLRALAAQQ